MKNVHFGRDYGSLYRKTMIYMREAFKPLDITFSEAIILIFICEKPGVIQDEVANALAVDKASTARSLKKLEEAGFLTREEDSTNQRVKKIFPTKLAIGYKQQFDDIMAHWNEIILADYDDKKQEEIQDIFHTMCEKALAVKVEKELENIKNYANFKKKACKG